MKERVLAKIRTSATPPVATQANSPLLHQRPFTDELSESVGRNSNISKELGGIQPKTIRRSLNWQNITVEAPSRGNGMSLPGGIQRQQEEPGAVSGSRVSADSVQKSPLESSNSTISTDLAAQKPLIARAPFNGRNIPVEAPTRSWASSTYPGGIQRLETTGVKEQEESTESLQMQPQGAIQAHSSEGEPQEKEEQNKESIQTKLTVGAPGDKYEQEADNMAAKVMAMPESAIQQPIQRQTGEETEAVQMQPLVNSITPLVQRSSGKEVDGSGEWGHDAKERGLTDRANHYMWTRVALASESMGLTNAARHMRHYLGNTGNPLTVNVNNMMRDVPNLATAYSEQLTLATEAANKKIAEMGNITKAQSFQVTGERMADVYCDKETSADWYYAIGSFTYWYTAKVTVVPMKDGKVQVQMMYTLHVYDRYNWDQGKSVTITGIPVKDEQLGRLHRVGLAREYDINGTSTPRRIEWNYSSSSPTADPANVPKGKDRDGARSDPSRDRGRHFNNVRGSSGSNR